MCYKIYEVNDEEQTVNEDRYSHIEKEIPKIYLIALKTGVPVKTLLEEKVA